VSALPSGMGGVLVLAVSVAHSTFQLEAGGHGEHEHATHP